MRPRNCYHRPSYLLIHPAYAFLTPLASFYLVAVIAERLIATGNFVLVITSVFAPRQTLTSFATPPSLDCRSGSSSSFSSPLSTWDRHTQVGLTRSNPQTSTSSHIRRALTPSYTCSHVVLSRSTVWWPRWLSSAATKLRTTTSTRISSAATISVKQP